jgi:hypothetical protein
LAPRATALDTLKVAKRPREAGFTEPQAEAVIAAVQEGTEGAELATKRADMEAIKVLAFDTGGTILDWHHGLVAALVECGARCGVERDWDSFTNEYRRRSLGRMLGAVEPSFNIDDVHREVLDELLDEDRGIAFPHAERRAIARWHELDAWADFVPGLVRLGQRYVCISFTILTLALVIDVSRRNAINWECRNRVRDAGRLQTQTRGLSARRKAPRGVAERNLDGRLPQFRSRRSARRRVPDGVRPPPGRMGSCRPARSGPKLGLRPRGRGVWRACRCSPNMRSRIR